MKEEMEAGEFEMRKHFEELTTRNVLASVKYANETRKIVRDLEKKILHLEKMSQQKDKMFGEMRLQISTLQQKLYSGGST